MSNYATRLVDGDVSLSIAITTICSLLCMITIPIGMTVLFELVMHKPIENFDIKKVSLQIFIIISIPTILGILTNRYFNFFLNKGLFYYSIKFQCYFFLLIISIAVYQERMNLGGYFEYVGVIAPIILFFVLFVSVIFTKFFVDGIDSQRSITVECFITKWCYGLYSQRTDI